MRFFQTVLASAALVGAAFAQLAINDYPSSVEAGKTYTITYSPKDDTPTTLILRKGISTDLETIATLTTSAVGGTFDWTVASDLPNGNDYALEIQQDGSEPNYSGQFPLTGGADASSSASSSASTSASSSAASSAASSSVSSASSSESTSEASSSVSASTTGSSVFLSSSAFATPSASSNGTSTNGTSSTGSSSRTNATVTDASGPPESTGAASVLSSSPLALVFGAIAAMVYLN